MEVRFHEKLFFSFKSFSTSSFPGFGGGRPGAGPGGGEVFDVTVTAQQNFNGKRQTAAPNGKNNVRFMWCNLRNAWLKRYEKAFRD